MTHDSILERFRECYEELYNSAGTEQAMDMIKAKLQNVIQENTLPALREIGKVTGKLVKQACGRMLPGKTDVTEVYTSDVFLNAPDSLFDTLAAIIGPILFMVQYLSRFSAVHSCHYSKEVSRTQESFTPIEQLLVPHIFSSYLSM